MVIIKVTVESGWPRGLPNQLIVSLMFIALIFNSLIVWRLQSSHSDAWLSRLFQPMRITSIVLNIILLTFSITVMILEGWPRRLPDQLLLCLMFIAPFFSLLTLWRFKPRKK